ncbi:glycosyltransferase family 1 protein [Spongiivirga citrea]|uniref:Glycosyltransferase n=1 Tax=Spongiivirga citrea TaxID=1481457 RepID=A0A6M0CCR1_9FLAO|nr:glycosyltransferase family 1 protein [Spongiivirga citrea]NER15575.1 glycosyltransferase [Spongiivirga citrea]
MEPIRVLQVLTIMNRGGAETMIMNYYRNIDRSVVQFDFLLHRKEEGVFDSEIKGLGGRIYRLQNISLKNLSSYKKELSHFFENHPEYRIVHSHLNALSVFVMKAAKKAKIPIRIAHSHTSLYNLNLNPFSDKKHDLSFAIRFFAQNFYKRKVPSYANVYFSCGKKAGNWLFGSKNSDKVRIINNAIDTHQFTYNPEISKTKKIALELSDKFIVGHVGNFVQEKNHRFIIEIFNELLKQEKNVLLVLVGAGDDSDIRKLADQLGLENQVVFLGARNDVPEILQAMDIFLFPSTNEGLPVTLIEAQAAGLPIIASDEISKELNVTGLVNFLSLKTPPLNWAKILLGSRFNRRSDMSKKIIEAAYDIKSNAKELQEFYCNN